jgi:hypothetical protein
VVTKILFKVKLSVEHVASIFRVEEEAKQETSMKLVESRTLIVACSVFRRNVAWLSKDWKALYPGR